MCIVVVSPKGQDFPSVEKIQNCVRTNPDGFAMSWNERGKVKAYKTMDANAIIDFYKKFIAKHNPKTTGLVFHARIATHGSKNIKNCHCWISDGLSFAHNGILDVANRGDMTDSETFFQDIFLPIYRSCGWDGARKAINACIGYSKFAFINGKGDTWGFGNFKECDGNYYSNDSHKSWEEKYPAFKPYSIRGKYYDNNKITWEKGVDLKEEDAYEDLEAAAANARRVEDKEVYDYLKKYYPEALPFYEEDDELEF